jgi:hypothetical protein
VDPEYDDSRPSRAAPFGLAGEFLLPFNPARHGESPAWAGAAVWLPVWGALIGIAYAAVFSITWRWLGEYQRIRLAPMAVLLCLDAGWLGFRLLESGARVVLSFQHPGPAGRPGPAIGATVFVVLALLIKFALLVALPAGAVTYPADWREDLSILYPYVIYRPLILMPLWGRWGVLLAGTIGRIAPGEPGRLGRLASGSSLASVMIYWVLITAVTVVYSSPAGRFVGWSMLLSLGMLLIAYMVSFVLARRFSGQTEASILAAGWAVETAFLLIYLPISRAIYWY